MASSLRWVLLVCAIFAARCRLGLCIVNCVTSIGQCSLSLTGVSSTGTEQEDGVVCTGARKALSCLDNIEKDCGTVAELLLRKARKYAEETFSEQGCASSASTLFAGLTHLVFVCVAMAMAYHIM